MLNWSAVAEQGLEADVPGPQQMRTSAMQDWVGGFPYICLFGSFQCRAETHMHQSHTAVTLCLF